MLVAALAVIASVTGAPSASAMEAPTPQAVDANAEFLAYAPPPPVPAKVCVVDTGVDLTTDAAPAVIERHSVFGGTTDDVGGSGLAKHGTLVAGVIASQADGRDSVGIWPQARIVSVRVFAGSGGGASAAAYVAALERCREAGVQVINLSLSGLDRATTEELSWLESRMVSLRAVRDISVVAGVGNNGGAVGYPARFPAVLAVGATDAQGGLCPISNRGAGLDITALGCGVQLSWTGGGLGLGDGTSYSTPVVSAVLAALRAYRPRLNAEEAERLLLGSSNGLHINATTAFAAAGLTSLIWRAPSDGTAATVAAPVIPRGDSRVRRATNVLAELGVRPPRLRSASFRGRLLSIRVRGVPDFGSARFRVDRRSYVRRSGWLRIRRARRPARISVAIDVPGVGRTEAISVRLGQRARKAASLSSTKDGLPT